MTLKFFRKLKMEKTVVNIGDRILGRHLGHMAPSNVVAIIDAKYLAMIASPEIVFGITNTWTERYPDWEEKSIIIGLFDNPIPTLTKKEMINDLVARPTIFTKALSEHDIPEAAMNSVYDAYFSMVPVTHYNYLPLEDVEVIYTAEEWKKDSEQD